MDHVQAEIVHAMRQRPLSRRRGPQYRVRMDGEEYPVARMWDSGFSVKAEDGPRLRGFVDLLHGGDLLARCLIVLAEQENGMVRYEYKRRTEAFDQPPPDYEVSDDAPVGLLT